MTFCLTPWPRSSEDADAVTVTDADDRKVAGQDARCFHVEGPDADAVVCVSRESGILLLIEGEMDGDKGIMELKSQRDPRDSDFDLPFEVSDFDFGDFLDGDDIDFENREPEQPGDPGIDAVRIAGNPYPWETGAALCPMIDLDESLYIFSVEVLQGGSFALGEKQYTRDCTESELENPYSVRTIDAAGNLYFSDFGGTIYRVSPNGTTAAVAGKDCSFGCAYNEDSKTEGAAQDVEIFGLSALAVTDGTVWFIAQDHTSNDYPTELRRVTSGGQVEIVSTPREDEKDTWINEILPGPGGTLYVVYWDKTFQRKTDGTYVSVRGVGDTCFAAGPDGVLWSYGWQDQELTALKSDGTTRSFKFQPDASFDFSCGDLAVEPNGDLLFLSAGFGDYPGLWRIPNPLKN